MPYVPGSSGSDESFEVTPERLRSAASLFRKASQDTVNTVHNLNVSAQELINEMSSELNKSPTALQQLCNSWRTSMNSLAHAIDKIGTNLDVAAGGYEQTDQHVRNTFQQDKPKGFGR